MNSKVVKAQRCVLLSLPTLGLGMLGARGKRSSQDGKQYGVCQWCSRAKRGGVRVYERPFACVVSAPL